MVRPIARAQRAFDSASGNLAVISRVVMIREPLACRTEFLTVDPRWRTVTDKDWGTDPDKAKRFDFLEADKLAHEIGVHAHALVLSGDPDPRSNPRGASFSVPASRSEPDATTSAPPRSSARSEPVKLFGYDAFD